MSFAKKLQTQALQLQKSYAKQLLYETTLGKILVKWTLAKFDNFTCSRREAARNGRHLVFAVQRRRRGRGPVLRLRRRGWVCRTFLADERDLVVLPAVFGVRLLPGELR